MIRQSLTKGNCILTSFARPLLANWRSCKNVFIYLLFRRGQIGIFLQGEGCSSSLYYQEAPATTQEIRPVPGPAGSFTHPDSSIYNCPELRSPRPTELHRQIIAVTLSAVEDSKETSLHFHSWLGTVFVQVLLDSGIIFFPIVFCGIKVFSCT